MLGKLGAFVGAWVRGQPAASDSSPRHQTAARDSRKRKRRPDAESSGAASGARGASRPGLAVAQFVESWVSGYLDAGDDGDRSRTLVSDSDSSDDSGASDADRSRSKAASSHGRVGATFARASAARRAGARAQANGGATAANGSDDRARYVLHSGGRGIASSPGPDGDTRETYGADGRELVDGVAEARASKRQATNGNRVGSAQGTHTPQLGTSATWEAPPAPAAQRSFVDVDETARRKLRDKAALHERRLEAVARQRRKSGVRQQSGTRSSLLMWRDAGDTGLSQQRGPAGPSSPRIFHRPAQAVSPILSPGVASRRSWSPRSLAAYDDGTVDEDEERARAMLTARQREAIMRANRVVEEAGAKLALQSAHVSLGGPFVKTAGFSSTMASRWDERSVDGSFASLGSHGSGSSAALESLSRLRASSRQAGSHTASPAPSDSVQRIRHALNVAIGIPEPPARPHTDTASIGTQTTESQKDATTPSSPPRTTTATSAAFTAQSSVPLALAAAAPVAAELPPQPSNTSADGGAASATASVAGAAGAVEDDRGSATSDPNDSDNSGSGSPAAGRERAGSHASDRSTTDDANESSKIDMSPRNDADSDGDDDRDSGSDGGPGDDGGASVGSNGSGGAASDAADDQDDDVSVVELLSSSDEEDDDAGSEGSDDDDADDGHDFGRAQGGRAAEGDDGSDRGSDSNGSDADDGLDADDGSDTSDASDVADDGSLGDRHATFEQGAGWGTGRGITQGVGGTRFTSHSLPSNVSSGTNVWGQYDGRMSESESDGDDQMSASGTHTDDGPGDQRRDGNEDGNGASSDGADGGSDADEADCLDRGDPGSGDASGDGDGGSGDDGDGSGDHDVDGSSDDGGSHDGGGGEGDESGDESGNGDAGPDSPSGRTHAQQEATRSGDTGDADDVGERVAQHSGGVPTSIVEDNPDLDTAGARAASDDDKMTAEASAGAPIAALAPPGDGLGEGQAGAPIGTPETEDRPATPPKVPSGDTTSEDESTPAVSHVSSMV